jgi:hypothetical protein
VKPITVAARSKARNVFSRTNTGIVGWNPTQSWLSAFILCRMIKSSRMGWTGRVARMGERGIAYRVLLGMSEGKRPVEICILGGSIKLKCKVADCLRSFLTGECLVFYYSKSVEI